MIMMMITFGIYLRPANFTSSEVILLDSSIPIPALSIPCGCFYGLQFWVSLPLIVILDDFVGISNAPNTSVLGECVAQPIYTT